MVSRSRPRPARRILLTARKFPFNIPDVTYITKSIMRGKLGLLLGLIAGAVLGFLFAPNPGSKLRAEIRKERAGGGTGLNAIKNSVKGAGKSIGDDVKKSKYAEKVTSLKKKLEDVIKNGEE